MSTLSWSLYRPGSEVTFRAGVAHGGYAIAVSRDGRELVTEQTCDASSLLRRSSELRESFERLGYTALPHDEDAARLPARAGVPEHRCRPPRSLIRIRFISPGEGWQATASRTTPTQ